MRPKLRRRESLSSQKLTHSFSSSTEGRGELPLWHVVFDHQIKYNEAALVENICCIHKQKYKQKSIRNYSTCERNIISMH